VRQERIADQADRLARGEKKRDRQTYGDGYLELVRNGQVIGQGVEFDVTYGHNNRGEVPGKPINETHSEKQTIDNVETWIRGHLNELQTGDVIHVLIYTEIPLVELVVQHKLVISNGPMS
jgi:hypothetical protein